MGLRQAGKKHPKVFTAPVRLAARGGGHGSLTITTQNFHSAPPDAELQMFRPDPTLCAFATGT
jgi:hypothetical protein